MTRIKEEGEFKEEMFKEEYQELHEKIRETK